MSYLDKANSFIENKDFDNAYKNLIKAIEANEYEAASILAMFYMKGLNGSVDIDKGLEMLYLGEKHNDFKSLSALGDLYYNGKYVDKDLDKAKEYYEAAFKGSEPHSIGMLGLFYFNEENYVEAVNYFKSGVVYYDQNSMYYLGVCAYNGLGMDKDYTLSFMLFDRLYSYGNRTSELLKYLADSYFNGYGIEVDYLKAKELYENLSDNESIFNLAIIYKNHLKEYEKALELFKRIKSVESQFEQALMLYNGLGVDENKNDAYFKFYACAMSKYIYSYPFVGDCYYYGYGVKKDYTEAIKWYELALNENIPNQYLNIGLAYLKLKKKEEAINYLNMEDDSIHKFITLAEIYYKMKKFDEAYEYYLKASNLDDLNSTYQIYKMLSKGKGVKKDKELASIASEE